MKTRSTTANQLYNLVYLNHIYSFKKVIDKFFPQFVDEDADTMRAATSRTLFKPLIYVSSV